MPRDLSSGQSVDQAALFTASPDAQTPRFESFADQIQSSTGKKKNLNPYLQVLVCDFVMLNQCFESLPQP